LQHELVLILDFGSQYTQLIARRVREQGVYCEIVPFFYPLEKILERGPKGVVL
jgi:GMP synthase (glutamine-hydrolysing)